MDGADTSAIDAETGLEKREVARARLLALISPRYNPWLHLAGTCSIGVVVVVLAALKAHDVRAVDYLIVPVTFFLATGFEWRVHKSILHKKFWPLEDIYRRHTPDHHAVYHEDDMSIRSFRELQLVLMPAIGTFAIVLSTAPFAYLVSRFLGANAGWLFLMTCGVFMVTYEVLHLSYHLPPETFIGRMRVIRFLARHHARHHNPRLMRRWNFNVTVPIFDWLYGTIAPSGDAREIAHAPRKGLFSRSA